MKLLIIGSDTKLFEEGSAVRTRTLRSVDMYDSYVVAVVSRSARYYHQKNIGAKKNTSFYSVYSPYRVLLFF